MDKAQDDPQTDTSLNTSLNTETRISKARYLLSALGPGLLMAAAAIGASHLVASTRAGAEFGWQLAWVILAVNLLKYPFFAAGADIKGFKETLDSGSKVRAAWTLQEAIARLGQRINLIFPPCLVSAFQVPADGQPAAWTSLFPSYPASISFSYIFEDFIVRQNTTTPFQSE